MTIEHSVPASPKRINSPPPPPTVLGIGHNPRTWRPPTPPPTPSNNNNNDNNEEDGDQTSKTWIGSLLRRSKRQRYTNEEKNGNDSWYDEVEGQRTDGIDGRGYRSPKEGLLQDDGLSKTASSVKRDESGDNDGKNGLEEVLIDHSLVLYNESTTNTETTKTTTKDLITKKGRKRRTVKDSLFATFGMSSTITDDVTSNDDVENQRFGSQGSTHGDRTDKSGLYHMMKSQHGNTTTTTDNNNNNNESPLTYNRSIFFENFNENQQTPSRTTNTNHKSPWSIWFTNKPQRPFSPPPPPSSEYFHNRTVDSFLTAHHQLNNPLPNKYDNHNGNHSSGSSDDTDDENFFFSLGQSQEARRRRHRRRNRNRDAAPAVSDLTKSSLSYMHGGKIRMRVPKDGVRLLMDPLLEPGILCVERNMENDQGRRRKSGDTDKGGSVSNTIGDGGNIDVDWKNNIERVEQAMQRQNKRLSRREKRRMRKGGGLVSSFAPSVEEERQNSQLRGEEGEEIYGSSSSRDGYGDNNYDLSIMKSLSEDSSYDDSESDEDSDGEGYHHHHRLKNDHKNSTSQANQQPPKHHSSHTQRRRRRGRPPALSYVLTVDQDLYKRVVDEMAGSLHTPCGLYFCCHEASGETKHVDIGVAIGVLFVVLMLMFIGTCFWPYS